jgi:hypothetical protein
MQPFNIDKFRAGAKVITRDGREVKQLTEFDCGDPFRLYGVLDNEIESWSIAGKYTDYTNDEGELDLFHPEPEMWVNVYENNNGILRAVLFTDKDYLAEGSFTTDLHIGTFKLVRDE